MKLTVRLSKLGQTIPQLLKPNHGLTGPISNWANIKGSEMYYGTAYAGPPSWQPFIASGTSQALNNLSNIGALSILFIPISKRYMVFTFGHSISKLGVAGFERDFGLKVVLNTVDPTKIKSIDSKLVDTVILNKRMQSSKENSIEDFGIDINKDLLRSVIGKPSSNSFGSMVAGSDTLTINCDVKSSTFLKKCNDISKAYTSTLYKKNYSWVDNVKAVKDKQDLTNLNNLLVAEFNQVLQGNPNSIFQLASPDILDFNQIDHFQIKGFRSSKEYPLPDFDSLITELTNFSISTVTLKNLMNYHVDAYGGAGSQISTKSWQLYDWLIFETSYNSGTYILSEGEWFEVSKKYHKDVDNVFSNIVSSSSEYKKIGTTTEHNETNYLTNYTVSADEIILDKAMSYVYGGGNQIEICDIYNKHGQFIHVKDGGASSKLSHLFNQGFVSATSYLADVNFRKDVKAKLKSKPILAATITNPPKADSHTIVFRILKSGVVFSLPFFTKVVIADIYKKVKSMGFKFKLEWVQKV